MTDRLVSLCVMLCPVLCAQFIMDRESLAESDLDGQPLLAKATPTNSFDDVPSEGLATTLTTVCRCRCVGVCVGV